MHDRFCVVHTLCQGLLHTLCMRGGLWFPMLSNYHVPHALVHPTYRRPFPQPTTSLLPPLCLYHYALPLLVAHLRVVTTWLTALPANGLLAMCHTLGHITCTSPPSPTISMRPSTTSSLPAPPSPPPCPLLPPRLLPLPSHPFVPKLRIATMWLTVLLAHGPYVAVPCMAVNGNIYTSPFSNALPLCKQTAAACLPQRLPPWTTPSAMGPSHLPPRQKHRREGYKKRSPLGKFPHWLKNCHKGVTLPQMGGHKGGIRARLHRQDAGRVYDPISRRLYVFPLHAHVYSAHNVHVTPCTRCALPVLTKRIQHAYPHRG